MIIRILSYLLYVLIAGASFVLFLDKKERPESGVGESPCRTPLTYHIGSIDDRFQISHEQLRRLLNGAVKVWSDAAGYGIQLLEYDPEGDVAIHLIYDDRQELVNQIQEYRTDITGDYRFSQGEYLVEEGKQRINIYHYRNLKHLRRVLTHEIGHALGIGHVETSGSVMYPVAESFGDPEQYEENRLSSEDIAAIQSLCNQDPHPVFGEE